MLITVPTGSSSSLSDLLNATQKAQGKSSLNGTTKYDVLIQNKGLHSLYIEFGGEATPEEGIEIIAGSSCNFEESKLTDINLTADVAENDNVRIALNN